VKLARRRRTTTVGGARPTHLGLVMDGNRRWARAAGYVDPRVGHRFGAEHVAEFLSWCAARDLEHLTIYVLSADNIRKRPGAELDHLFELLATTIPQILTNPDAEWSLHVSGDRSLLPAATDDALADAERRTADRPRHCTLAIGYDGRRDIVDSIRSALLSTPADEIDADAITAGLGGGPVKEIDLVIRTSGEIRLSGFLPWQSAYAELYVTPKLWPAFTEQDLDRALAHFESVRARG